MDLDPGGMSRRPRRAASLPRRAEGAMIVTKGGRTYSCTECRHKGAPCAEGLEVLEHLARSLATAGGAIRPDFEMQGCVRLSRCGRPCTALFRVTTARLHLFCDLEPGDWSPGLVRMADLLVGPAGPGRPAVPLPAPAALVVASAAAAPGPR